MYGSPLAFANEFGWIGHTGLVSDGKSRLVPAVGLGKWREEIQAMIAAHYLWECIQKEDKKTLRQYFIWDRTEFAVRSTMGIEDRQIRGKNHPGVKKPPLDSPP